MNPYVLLHAGRDEGGRWLYERLIAAPKFYRRRPGQRRQEIPEAEWMALVVEPPKPAGPDRPEPAGTYERPNFGPRGRA